MGSFRWRENRRDFAVAGEKIDGAYSCRVVVWCHVIMAASLVSDELLRSPGSLMLTAPCNNGGFVGYWRASVAASFVNVDCAM